MRAVRAVTLAVVAMVAISREVAFAQDEGAIHAAFRREGERVKEDCSGGFSVSTITGCAITLFTDHPLHIATGSLAPLNGTGFGPALSFEFKTGTTWRNSISTDAAVATSGAWRSGVYLILRHTNVQRPVVLTGTSSPADSGGGIHPYPLFSVYAQRISLPTIAYFGLGDDAPRTSRTAYSMRQTIVGGNAVLPIYATPVSRLNLALLGEVNGRSVGVSGSDSGDAPSIETLFDEASAPGLGSQPGFFQFGEGVRIAPSIFDSHLRLDYLAKFQQFVTASDATSAFRRWTVDLKHEIPIGRRSAPAALPQSIGPDECVRSGERCPAMPPIRTAGVFNRSGTITVRALASRSGVSEGNVVPFYFQQTLGGADVNGERTLPGYDDYRFRGAHLILFQETVEHSIAGPVGAFVEADEGRVFRQDESLGLSSLRRSFSVGATLRAGAFPLVVISYGTGGAEGHHIIVSINSSLLGSSPRPSLQ